MIHRDDKAWLTTIGEYERDLINTKGRDHYQVKEVARIWEEAYQQVLHIRHCYAIPSYVKETHGNT